MEKAIADFHTTRRGFLPALASIVASIPAAIGLKSKPDRADRFLLMSAERQAANWKDAAESWEEIAEHRLKLLQAKWIPVTERLPDSGRTVLVVMQYWDSSRGIEMTHYIPTMLTWKLTTGGITPWGYPYPVVTHWAELPVMPDLVHVEFPGPTAGKRCRCDVPHDGLCQPQGIMQYVSINDPTLGRGLV